MIVEQEQNGKEHSEYGSDLLKKLFTHLTGRFGKGFSATNLKYARQFYQTYAPSIQQLNSTKSKTNVVNRQSPIDEFNLQKLSLNRQSMFGELPFKLSWTHYQALTSRFK
jgi:hypothetical protein